ncbi:MAG: LysM peptidoglycan-binding domain-containing protein [Candidatus Sericytochromatia bacterium]
MPNVNTHPAAAASASLGIETQRAQQVQQSASPSPVATPQATSLSTGEQYQVSEYKVRKGDTLWDIAKVKMGDANKWPELFALNKNQIRNPNLIFPGQVLAVPQQVQVAPTVPSQPVSSPVDSSPPPAPVTPAPPPPTPVAEEVIVPSQPAAPEPPAPPPAPVAQEPVAPEPVAPQPEPVQAPPASVQPEAPIYLRPPEEMPYPDDPLAVAPPAETPAEPTAPTEPEAPAVPAQPTPPPYSTIGQPSQAENKGSGIGKAAIIGGVLGTAGTGAALIGITKTLAAPVSNLGGYATAQVVAKSINTVTSKVGLKVPTGPALTQAVSKIGGPKVAGAVTAVAVGAVVAGVAAGGYYLYNRATQKDEPATPDNQTPPLPQGPAAPAQPSAPSASSDAAAALGNLQPVVDENARPPVDVSSKFQELDGLLKEKKYMFFGAATRPDDIRAVGVQIWLDGQVDDRVKLANTLVSNGQAELLGRIMSHEETQPVEIAQVMSQPAFPVGEYMKALDDNQAFLVLNALSGVAAMGEPQSARVIGDTVKAYDGIMDREGPFKQLREHHQSVGSWNQLPADLRQQIDQLLK